MAYSSKCLQWLEHWFEYMNINRQHSYDPKFIWQTHQVQMFIISITSIIIILKTRDWKTQSLHQYTKDNSNSSRQQCMWQQHYNITTLIRDCIPLSTTHKYVIIMYSIIMYKMDKKVNEYTRKKRSHVTAALHNKCTGNIS